ncbi:cation:dicarboxylate symporter family transporter [Thalassotalea mangrovi]|uniref:Cation:dicarboxylase symporter family transporter n=1 Tax=Thalassotalea mangrovi TaxID=2572245 RepID=A0A4U1BAI3_9GAMM|nr:cation:dicarboxylase symporter family transporter [Thalassotalea mangrovi]TKB47546.1 cation:dicarboxylase symporter family transporter [Thalassotalea mangrovi]
MSQANKIIIAMMAGLLIGFTSDYTNQLINYIGQGFVMLLQMTALPYIAVSLVFGIGSMTRQQAKRLVKYGTVCFLILLLVVVGVILLAPIAFPDWNSAAFYSASIIREKETYNVLDYFLPANPFRSLAAGTVPAVVVFSIFIGIGFISIHDKRRSLYVFKDIRQALIKVTNTVMKLAPYGVLAIAWDASASLAREEMDGLLVYFVTTASMVFLLTFVILPLIVAIFTPLRFSQVFLACRSALITGFATGSIFVVIPVIAEDVKKQLIAHAKHHNSSTRLPSIIAPISYSLPMGGKLLVLLFILFAAWFNGEQIALYDYPELVVVGVLQLFGSQMVAVPNILDSFAISASMFELYVVAEQLLVSRLAALLSVMFITVCAMLIPMVIMHKVRFYLRPFIIFIIAVPLCTSLILAGLSFTFNSISHQYQGYEKFIDRDLLLPAAKSQVLKTPQPDDTPDIDAIENTLERITVRGKLRMGYYADALPYAFHNKNGELVGLDIEIGHLLAQELEVEIEFVRIQRNNIETYLNQGYLDIVASLPVTPGNLINHNLSNPHIKETLALLVKDEERSKYANWTRIIEDSGIVLGMPETHYYEKTVQKNMPKNTVHELSSPRQFFIDDSLDIDAMIYGAAGASAWTLLYPDYTVVIPEPRLPEIGMAFPLQQQDYQFEQFLNNWIAMKKNSKTIDALFTFWIEGKQPVGFIR